MDKKFVLWGHDLEEYQAIFDLSEEDLSKSILEFGAGPSSFNIECSSNGGRVVSCDVLFNEPLTYFTKHVDETFANTVKHIKSNELGYNLKPYGDLEGLVVRRERGIRRFFEDFEQGKADLRYVGLHDLPLPFKNNAFDLALVAHNLFVNYEEQSIEQHVACLKELLRVSTEVRVFPLIDKFGQTSNFLGPVMLALQQANFAVEVREVTSQLQPSGNAMLRLCQTQCDVI